MELELVQIGFISSIISYIFNLFPKLGNSGFSRALVAIIITTILSYVYNSEFTFESVITSLVYALTTYKMILQPISEKAGVKVSE